ncbi:hypothetical protein M9Y10_010723 [Tritrichomonas musculus]|uniref:3'-5' exonuclease domain-containing protein n=1 Tax=Tritrichomonas musculus TaxID=1915356 RepID=A0ABR2IMU9_9EUKA
MTLEDTLSQVNCPITGAKFSIVRKEIPRNVTQFNQWTEDVLKRANSGKTVNIAIDCEGYFLGTIKKSLSCIQIGEIYNDSFNVYQSTNPPSIGNKSGFIILNPFCNKVKNNLSSVLSHPNVMIYTFDFVGDFSTMIEAGININLNNVFDSQVATQSYNSNLIQNKSGKSLSWFVEEAEGLDPFAQVAKVTKNRDKRNYFCVTSYLFKDSKNPTSDILTKELLEMGAADVYMTGLAATYCISKQLSQKVLVNTSAKVAQFKQFANSFCSYLAPSICRHLFFIDSYSAWKYNDNNLLLRDETEKDLINLLRIFQDTYSIISSYLILNSNNLSQISYYRADQIYRAVALKLEKNRPKLVEMMKKYA